MIATVLIFCVVAAAVGAAEWGGRLFYRKTFLVPFLSKAIGEYPYGKFIEEADPPLYFTVKENFASPMISINRFGCRGPEPAPDGAKRRVLALGESNLFGAKLRRQEDLWSVQMEQRLRENGHTDWEVINASIPGYNSVQTYWRYLDLVNRIAPEILLLSLGGNDISQMYVMGEKWTEGAPWSREFIKALERKAPMAQRIGTRSCLYFLWRRQSMTKRKGFSGAPGGHDWDRCFKNNFHMARQIIDDARKRGITVVLSGIGPAYSLRPTPSDERKLDSIQANWRENLTGAGAKMVEYGQKLSGEFADKNGVMGIDFTRPFWEHPQRFVMFHDVFHWNPAGHELVAEIVYRRFDEAGLWE